MGAYSKRLCLLQTLAHLFSSYALFGCCLVVFLLLFLSLPSYYLFYAAMLAMVPHANSAPPTVPRTIHGRLFKMGVYIA